MSQPSEKSVPDAQAVRVHCLPQVARDRLLESEINLSCVLHHA